jgi:hypothetical protein
VAASFVTDVQVYGNTIQVKRRTGYFLAVDQDNGWETIHTGTDCPTS